MRRLPRTMLTHLPCLLRLSWREALLALQPLLQRCPLRALASKQGLC